MDRENMGMPNVEGMEKIFALIGKVSLLFDILPDFDIKVIKMHGKEYIAILFEKPTQKEAKP